MEGYNEKIAALVLRALLLCSALRLSGRRHWSEAKSARALEIGLGCSEECHSVTRV